MKRCPSQAAACGGSGSGVPHRGLCGYPYLASSSRRPGLRGPTAEEGVNAGAVGRALKPLRWKQQQSAEKYKDEEKRNVGHVSMWKDLGMDIWRAHDCSGQCCPRRWGTCSHAGEPAPKAWTSGNLVISRSTASCPKELIEEQKKAARCSEPSASMAGRGDPGCQRHCHGLSAAASSGSRGEAYCPRAPAPSSRPAWCTLWAGPCPILPIATCIVADHLTTAKKKAYEILGEGVPRCTIMDCPR